MQTSNANKRRTSNDPVWQFLAEYPLSEFISDHDKEEELTTGLLQTMRDLRIPPEYLEKIEMTLTGFAKEALEHFKQGSLELPGRIRVFCQKKMIDSTNSVKTSRLYNAEQAIEQVQIIHPSVKKMNGGWGYFLIEKGGDLQPGSSVSTYHLIDLYLYKEGE